MRIAVVGSRSYPHEQFARAKIRAILRKYPEAIIVSGGARGPDSWAEREARDAGMSIDTRRPRIAYPCSKFHYRVAAFARNTEIAESCDILVAFHTANSPTHGTLDTVRKALEKHKQVYIYDKNMSLLRSREAVILYLVEANYSLA